MSKRKRNTTQKGRATRPTFPEPFPEYCKERAHGPAELSRLDAYVTDWKTATELMGLSHYTFRGSSGVMIIPGREPNGKLHPTFCHAIALWDNDKPSIKRVPSRDISLSRAILMPGHPWGRKLTGTVVLGESALKSSVVSQHLGIPAIGINGIWGLSEGDKQIVDNLKSPPWNWDSTRLVILFDSLHPTDFIKRQNQLLAEEWSAMLFHKHTGNVCVAQLPPPPKNYPKATWGVDDFYMAHGADALRQVIDQAELYVPEDNMLLKTAIGVYNRRFVYVKQLNKIYDLEEPGMSYRSAGFKEAHGNEYFTSIKDKRISIPKVWMVDSRRNTASRIVFRPGEEKLIQEKQKLLNVWDGLAIEPDPNFNIDEVQKYYVDVVEEVLGDNGADNIAVFFDIQSAILRDPSMRLSMYLYLGGEFGTGKNYILHAFRQAFGIHTANLTAAQYSNKFNFAKVNARNIFINELGSYLDGPTSAAIEAELKLDADATELTRTVEAKGRELITVERNAFVVILSNFIPPFNMEWGERRCFALRSADCMAIVGQDVKAASKTEAWWGERWRWMEQGGIAQVLGWLVSREMGELPAQAPNTDYKRNIIRGKAERGVAGWLKQVKNMPEDTLHYGGVDLSGCRFMTPEQLLRLYKSQDIDSTLTVGGMGTALRQANFTKDQQRVDKKIVRFVCLDKQGYSWLEDKELVTKSIKEVANALRGAIRT